MSVTIRDVAKAAGVSPSTVSKVLNKSPLISQPTIDLVNSVIEELHYVPNLRARNFAKGETKSIVFLTLFEPHMALMNPYIFEICSGIEQVVKTKDYALHYISAASIEEAHQIVQRLIIEKSADGIILHGYAVSPEIASLLVEHQFPHVLIGKPGFECSACWIDNNNILAGEVAINYLYECNLRKIAFIGGRKTDRISQMRFHGVRQFAMQKSLTLLPEHLKHGEPTIEDGYRLAREVLSSSVLPDGIICENSLSAVGVVKAIREANLSIPDDISFICFDNYPFSFMIDPLPTVVDIDVYSLGTEAGKLLLRKIKNPNLHFQSYITLPSVLERNSTPRRIQQGL